MIQTDTAIPELEPFPRRMDRFYRFHSRIYDHTRWLILHGREAAVRALNLSPGSSVLDVGCGTGSNFKYMVDAVGPEGRVVGVDASEPMLRVAGKRIQRKGWSNVEARLADASELSLDERFDGVVFGYSAAVIPRWEPAIEKAAEHLKPGGTLCVLEFGTFSAWPRLIGGVAKAWLNRNHVKVYRPIEAHMRTCLEDVQVRRRHGDYYIIATGKRSARTGSGVRHPLGV